MPARVWIMVLRSRPMPPGDLVEQASTRRAACEFRVARMDGRKLRSADPVFRWLRRATASNKLAVLEPGRAIVRHVQPEWVTSTDWRGVISSPTRICIVIACFWGGCGSERL